MFNDQSQKIISIYQPVDSHAVSFSLLISAVRGIAF